MGESAATKMPDTHTEYARPHIRPWFAVAAALTAQWQAPETSQVRPASMSSNAPLRTASGAASPGLTVASAYTEPPAKPAGSNS